MTETEAVKKTIEKWKNRKAGIIDDTECVLCAIFDCDNRCPLDTPTLKCNARSSPWKMWRDGVDESEQAQRIINACKRWLKKRRLYGR